MFDTNIKRKCALYMRVSTDDQAREGFSLGEQRLRLSEYCKAVGYDIYDFYEDSGISAKEGNYRPAFEKMLEDGKKGYFDTIVTIKLDRISPNEPLEYDNGYHGTAGVNAFTVTFDDNDFNKSEEEVYNEMLDKLKELNIYDKDLVPVSNDS